MPVRRIDLGIVDDHLLFRKTLKNYLSEQRDLSVVVQASNIADLWTCLKEQPVDVLLMDLYMPGTNGSEALKAILAKFPALKIIVLSMNTDMELVSDVMDSGIHGYVCKADEPEELLQAINTVATGRIYRNNWFIEALYWKEQAGAAPCANAFDTVLSEREKKFLQLLWDEKNSREIAVELFLGVRSVEKIRQDLKEKIGVKSTVGLLKYSINKKIIDGKFPGTLANSKNRSEK